MSGGYGSHSLVKNAGKNSYLLQRLMKLVYPPMPTLNIIPSKIMKKICSELFSSQKIVVNIGSGGINGCGFKLWSQDIPDDVKVHHLDIISNDDVSIVGDAHKLPLQDESVDSLIYQAVLEHVKHPDLIIKEAYRVLKPGGMLYLEVPFLQGFHADPYDFQRYTIEGLRVLTCPFNEMLSGASVGPFCSLVWLLRDGFSSCFNNKWLYAFSRFTMGWLLSPVRYLDYTIRNNSVAKRLACENYFLCQKPMN